VTVRPGTRKDVRWGRHWSQPSLRRSDSSQREYRSSGVTSSFPFRFREVTAALTTSIGTRNCSVADPSVECDVCHPTFALLRRPSPVTDTGSEEGNAP
jgi:hypothetical protein